MAPPDQPAAARPGIVNGTLTWNRTNNPRRTACPWCHAPIAAPCRDVRGRDLSWYHADRTTAAELPDPDPPPLPAPVAPPQRSATRQGQRTSQPRRPGTEPYSPGVTHEPNQPRRPRNHLDPPGRLPHPPTRTLHTSCAQWLTHQLTQHGGTLPAHDLINAAHTAGYSRTTLHRTRTRLGILTTKPAYTTGWYWNLPTPTLEPSIPETAMTSLTQAGQLALTINTKAANHRARS
jgi:hypothetical protein